MTDSFFSAELHELVEGLLTETLSPPDQERLQVLLKTSSEARHYYLNYLSMHVQIQQWKRLQPGSDGTSTHGELDLLSTQFLSPGPGGATILREPTLWKKWSVVGVVASCCLIAALFFLSAEKTHVAETSSAASTSSGFATNTPSIAEEPSSAHEAPSGRGPIVLKQNFNARFYQDITPALGANMALNHEFVLLEGQVELEFPRGACAIFEAPAVFELNSPEQICVSFGNCSVYAPSGSEGFQVFTPQARLVDRGTRFNVNVNESGGSQVHVVEGMVEASETKAQARVEAQLFEGDARQFFGNDSSLSSAIDYNPAGYRRQLPDRLVTFDGPRNEQQEIEGLSTAVVCRGGTDYLYSFSELIGSEITSFCATGCSPTATFVMPPDFHGDHLSLLRHDNSFLTGIVNPGGAIQPETGVIRTPDNSADRQSWTPGMTIQFHKPVMNSAGPDILIFEIQTAVHPIAGDHFHLRPLHLAEGQHPMTVRKYDLGMLSPESLPVSRFALLEPKAQIASLEDLSTLPLSPSHVSINYRVVATSIDLSEMGLARGDTLQTMFLQDIQDDEHRIDPVMIVGLPPVAVPHTKHKK